MEWGAQGDSSGELCSKLLAKVQIDIVRTVTNRYKFPSFRVTRHFSRGVFPMLRRSIALAVLAVLVSISGALAADPLPVDAGGVTGLDLKTQLEKGLLARRPVEFEYIREIIKLVESGELPREMVTTTFVWARKKPSRRLQNFQFALQTRAQRLPVKLPDLRKQAVGISSDGGEHGVDTP
jgi:hypothetical protein